MIPAERKQPPVGKRRYRYDMQKVVEFDDDVTDPGEPVPM
jgi:hypothetical protein